MTRNYVGVIHLETDRLTLLTEVLIARLAQPAFISAADHGQQADDLTGAATVVKRQRRFFEFVVSHFEMQRVETPNSIKRVETPKKGLRMRSPFGSSANALIRERISLHMHHDAPGKDVLSKVPSPMTPAKIRARRQSEKPLQVHDSFSHANHNCENLDPQKQSLLSPIYKAAKSNSTNTAAMCDIKLEQSTQMLALTPSDEGQVAGLKFFFQCFRTV